MCKWNHMKRGGLCGQPLDPNSKIWCTFHYEGAKKVWEQPEPEKKPQSKIELIADEKYL